MSCPAPLLVADENATNFVGAGCGFSCLGTMYDEDDLQGYHTQYVIVGIIGLTGALFVFLTWGMFAQKAAQKMTFWVAFSSVGVTSCIILPFVFAGNLEDVLCESALEPKRQSDGPSTCLLQAVALIFFGLKLCAWWWCSCFDLFSKLYLRRRNISHYLRYYAIFGWSMPAFNVLVLLASNRLGFEQPRLWCFLNPEAPDYAEYVFFYAWVIMLWLTGTIMMFLVVWSILSYSRTRKAQPGQKNKPNFFKKLSLYATPILFAFAFVIFWACFFLFLILTEVLEEELEDSAVTWFNCLLIADAQDIQDPANEFNPVAPITLDPQPKIDPVIVDGVPLLPCGDVQPGRLSPGLIVIIVSLLAGNGIIIFSVFGLQRENFKLWKDWFGRGCSFAPLMVTSADGQFKTPVHSIFKEMRLGLRNFTVYLCNKMAGEETDLNNNGPNSHVGRDAVAVSAVQGGGVPDEFIPRLSLRKGSAKSTDPFPTATGGGQERAEGGVSLEQFYTTPTPTGPDANRNRRTLGGWSDIYNDPLWGVNVEF